MVASFTERIMRLVRKQKGFQDGELTVALDTETVERIQRLREKTPIRNNDELIATALKYLEHKTDKIIRRQVLRRIRALNREGFSPKQIAARLNEKRIPSPGEETHYWHGEMISDLIHHDEKLNAVSKRR